MSFFKRKLLTTYYLLLVQNSNKTYLNFSLSIEPRNRRYILNNYSKRLKSKAKRPQVENRLIFSFIVLFLAMCEKQRESEKEEEVAQLK